ncbi:hypothetical protein [Paraflavitalea speifideaquila]|uniref:hypothetical protein n=1 Tax=Paraflavitalea speifideaquila TaxID=3076558 RepID=UPI0028E204B0|nr:hypothetical protein [Paraflavitalea speifideiaquila]
MLAAGVIVWLYKVPPSSKRSLNSNFLIPVLLQVINNDWTNEKINQIGWFFLRLVHLYLGAAWPLCPFFMAE